MIEQAHEHISIAHRDSRCTILAYEHMVVAAIKSIFTEPTHNVGVTAVHSLSHACIGFPRTTVGAGPPQEAEIASPRQARADPIVPWAPIGAQCLDEIPPPIFGCGGCGARVPLVPTGLEHIEDGDLARVDCRHTQIGFVSWTIVIEGIHEAGDSLTLGGDFARPLVPWTSALVKIAQTGEVPVVGRMGASVFVPRESDATCKLDALNVAPAGRGADQFRAAWHQ
jgi:hypothetical protein